MQHTGITSHERAAQYIANAAEFVPAFVDRFLGAMRALGGFAEIISVEQKAWRSAVWGVDDTYGMVSVRSWSPPSSDDVFPAIEATLIDRATRVGPVHHRRGMFAVEWEELVSLADFAAAFIALNAPHDHDFRQVEELVGVSDAIVRQLGITPPPDGEILIL